MKIQKIIAVSALVLAFTFGGNTANAALSPFTFTGNNVNINPLTAGSSGTIGNIGHVGRSIISQVAGTLPSNTAITFTYDFSGNLDFGYLAATGGYNFNDGSSNFTGFTNGNNLTGSNSAGFVNGSPSTALAVASAQVDFTNNTATAIITNTSSDAVNFLNLFVGLVSGNRNLEIAYNVSAVPLPAALPLFAAALAGLMGFSRRRKKLAAA